MLYNMKKVPSDGIGQHSQEVQRRMVLVVIFFRIFQTTYFFYVVAISDLVHNEEAIFHLP